MAILNYTTKVPVLKTVGELQYLLATKGASSVHISYENREPIALHFGIQLGKRVIEFCMPCKWQHVQQTLLNAKEVDMRMWRTAEHAKRVAWRILLDWVSVQMAFVEAGQADIVEVFLPYAVTPSGKSLYEVVCAPQCALLTSSNDNPKQPSIEVM